jgi:hypothetical protein
VSGYRPWWLRKRGGLTCPTCRAPMLWVSLSRAVIEHRAGCPNAHLPVVERLPLARMDATAVLVLREADQ